MGHREIISVSSSPGHTHLSSEPARFTPSNHPLDFQKTQKKVAEILGIPLTPLDSDETD